MTKSQIIKEHEKELAQLRRDFQILANKPSTPKRISNKIYNILGGVSKAPSYTAILKAIQQLDRVQELVVEYRGKYSLSKRIYRQYNAKNRKIRYPKTK